MMGSDFVIEPRFKTHEEYNVVEVEEVQNVDVVEESQQSPQDESIQKE